MYLKYKMEARGYQLNLLLEFHHRKVTRVGISNKKALMENENYVMLIDDESVTKKLTKTLSNRVQCCNCWSLSTRDIFGGLKN